MSLRPTREQTATAGVSHAHLSRLDGLRALAAFLVVMTHATFLTSAISHGVLGRLAGRGDMGVAIFFTLSGFLLHRSLLADAERGHLEAKRYYLRRAARVLPAYWLCLLVVCVFAWPGASVAVLEFFGLQIYVADAHIPEFSQSWSIATELSFYLVLPFVFAGLQRLRRRDGGLPTTVLRWSLGLGVLATWVASSGEIGEQVLFERWLPARWANFALGMLFAEIALQPLTPLGRRVRSLASQPGSCLALAAAAYLLSTTAVAGQLTLGVVSGLQLAVKMTLSCVVAGGIMIPLLWGTHPAISTVMAGPTVRWLGSVSYGIFLWHLPVFSALYAITGLDYFSGGLVPLLALGIPTTLGLAALSYYVVERPLIARSHRDRVDRPPATPLRG